MAMDHSTAITPHDDLVAFYDDAYSQQGERAQLYGRWRAIGAVGKADHVVELCRRARIDPASTLDVGCGDGALLGELHTRGFGGRLRGVEICAAAVEIAARRPEIEAVELYDGKYLPACGHDYDLGLVSHVLEHVPKPSALLSEVARVCKAVVLEVPLEHNLSASRVSKRGHAEEIGHLQRLSRASMRAIVARAGLRVVAELEDPLPRVVHAFFADGPRARAKAALKWATRGGLHRSAPALARRLFTLHYACLCVPSSTASPLHRGSPGGPWAS